HFDVANMCLRNTNKCATLYDTIASFGRGFPIDAAGEAADTPRKERRVMPEVLTQRQREILDYLKNMLKEKAYPPTVREIGLAIGLSSSSTVQNHLNTLERKGYIKRDPAKSRAIEMVEKDAPATHRNGRITKLRVV